MAASLAIYSKKVADVKPILKFMAATRTGNEDIALFLGQSEFTSVGELSKHLALIESIFE